MSPMTRCSLLAVGLLCSQAVTHPGSLAQQPVMQLVSWPHLSALSSNETRV
jgi:hypothetical protein